MISNEPYSTWGEARGIPVEIKEARGDKNTGKWNDAFGQDLSAISNFVSLRWFQGEYQPGFFIMGIKDDGTIQGFTYAHADALMKSAQSAMRSCLTPCDQIKLIVEMVRQDRWVVIVQIPPITKMCYWRGKRYTLLGDGSAPIEANTAVAAQFPYSGDLSAGYYHCVNLDVGLVVAYAKFTGASVGLQFDAIKFLEDAGLKDTVAARVLFSKDITYKVGFYNHEGNAVDTIEGAGLFSLFSTNVMESLQNYGTGAGKSMFQIHILNLTNLAFSNIFWLSASSPLPISYSSNS